MSMIQAQLVDIRFFCGDKALQFEQNLSSVDKVDFLYYEELHWLSAPASSRRHFALVIGSEDWGLTRQVIS